MLETKRYKSMRYIIFHLAHKPLKNFLRHSIRDFTLVVLVIQPEGIFFGCSHWLYTVVSNVQVNYVKRIGGA